MQITAILLRTTALVSTFFLGVVAPPPGQIQCSGGVAFRGVYKNKKPIRQYFTHAEDQIKSWSGGTCNPSCQVTPGDYRFDCLNYDDGPCLSFDGTFILFISKYCGCPQRGASNRDGDGAITYFD